jgi:hypothetical protein
MGYGKSKSCMMYLFNMIKEGPTNIYTIDQMTVFSIFSSIVSLRGLATTSYSF